MPRYLITTLLFFMSFQLVHAQRMNMRKNEISFNQDELTGNEVKKINLPSGSLKAMAESSIGLIYCKDSTYKLYSYLYKTGWLAVESMAVTIDGALFEFPSVKVKRETFGQYCSEKNWYVPSAEFLAAFKKAKIIRFKLNGDDASLEFKLTRDQVFIIPDFFN